MATIVPKGEKVKQAVKWIAAERMEDEEKGITLLIQRAAAKFNLSPKDEEFLQVFYRENE